MFKKTLKILIVVLSVAMILSGCSFASHVGPAPNPGQQQEATQSQQQSSESSSESQSQTEQGSQTSSEEQTRDYLFTLDELKAAIVESFMPFDAVIDALKAAGLEKVKTLGFIPRGAINTGADPGVVFGMDVYAGGPITKQQAQAIVDSLKSDGFNVTDVVSSSKQDSYLFTVIAEKDGYQLSIGYASEDIGGDDDNIHVVIVPPEKEKVDLFLDFAKLGMKRSAKLWNAVASAIDKTRIVYSLNVEGGAPKLSIVVYGIKKSDVDNLLNAVKNRLGVTVSCLNDAMCDITGEYITGAVMQINQETFIFSIDTYR